MEMEYRKLGQTDLRPSVLSLGCNRLGTTDGDAAEAEATLLEAFECGVNFFDTADYYNHGDSERVLGKVFRGKRDRILICSKAGWTKGSLQRPPPKAVPLVKRIVKRWSLSRKAVVWIRRQFVSQNFDPDYIEKAIVGSLRRLETDYLDLFLIHSPTISTLLEDSLFDRLDELRGRGMIRHYGVSFLDSVTSEELAIGLTRPGISALQIAIDIYHLPTIDNLKNKLGDTAIGVIGRAPFARGALFHDDRGLAALAQCNLAAPAQAAIRLAVQVNPLGPVLIGMANRQHLRENLRALALPPISDENLESIASLSQN